MNTTFESKPERPLETPREQMDADSRRRAECAEKISRLLSALDGGASKAKPETATKSVVRETKSNPAASLRFLLMDKAGPIGEFGSWEDARNDLKQSDTSSVGVETKALEPATVPPQANHPAQPQATQLESVQQEPVQPQPAQQQPTEQQAAQQPAIVSSRFNSPDRITAPTQELKTTDKPGDSHPISLGQCGAPPANSTKMRVIGKIFPSAAKTVTLNARPKFLTNRHELLVQGNSSAQVTSQVGFCILTETNAPSVANHETINIHYTS